MQFLFFPDGSSLFRFKIFNPLLDFIRAWDFGVTSKQYIAFSYPQWKIVNYDSLEDAADMIANEEADCFLMGASQAMTYDNSKNFKSIPLTKTMEARIAVKSGEGILLSILNKTLKTMSSDMLTSALAIYDSTADKVTFSDFVKDNMFAFLSRQNFSYLASLVLSSYFYRRREKQKLSQGLLQMIHKSLMTSRKSL